MVPAEAFLTDDARFAGHAITCELSESVCSDGKAETATFCFAAGIGKVWEESVGDVRERLVAWDVPGGSSSGR